MSGRYKRSIRRELFALILLTLALHVVVLLLAGSRLFERFYTAGKSAELKSAARLIQKNYRELPENLFEVINEVENQNTMVTLFTLGEDGSCTVDYHTRFRGRRMEQKEELSDGEMRLNPPPISSFFDKIKPTYYLNEEQLSQEAARLSQGKAPLLVTREEDEFGAGRLRLVSVLEEGQYLLMDTPLEYIRSIAEQAVRYTFYLSVFTLMIGTLGIYLLSGRITRPIRHMQRVAEKIAQLDFSESCPVRSRNELGALGESINHMAGQLQQNIEKLVAANELLQSDLSRQQQTDRMRRQFIADVSHDFKTPLTLIISYAEALEEETDGELRREYTATIREEGGRLSRMVGSLLRLSQLECGMQKLEPALFCLDELLLEVVGAHRILAQKRELKVETRIESGLIVRADYQKAEQAAANLYENALKYAAQGGRVLVSAAAEGESCRVCVENDGEKIPEEELPRLFESFYRADRSRRRDGQSYGLGLAIVKAIIELHGERCGCENRPGGVRFWFTLPLARLEEEEGEV